MAKKSSTSSKSSAKKTGVAPRKPGKAVTASSSASRRSSGEDGGIREAVIKFLQSPLVADLLAVAATAALAALAEHGFSNREGAAKAGGNRAGRAVKEAGKAAAAAISRRIGNEFQEIRAASNSVKDSVAK